MKHSHLKSSKSMNPSILHLLVHLLLYDVSSRQQNCLNYLHFRIKSFYLKTIIQYIVQAKILKMMNSFPYKMPNLDVSGLMETVSVIGSLTRFGCVKRSFISPCEISQEGHFIIKTKALLFS